jgi:hypothetical protein
MRMSRYVGLLACLLILLVVAAGQNPQSSTLPVGSATVADFQGEVTLHAPDGSTIAADRGMMLAADTVIDTGKGSTLLNLQDGSQILVKAHSHVVLKAPNQKPGDSLELTLGKILAKIKKRTSNSPSFRMGTPTAVITVRGTRFEVEVDKKQRTRVEVYEGMVEVTGMGAGMGGVMLRPGFMTHVQANRDPERPRESMEREGGVMPGPGGIGRESQGEGRVGSENEAEGSKSSPDTEQESGPD